MAISQCNAVVDRQGRELTERGTAQFPIACYHDDLQKEAVPWHWHDDLEALIVSEGCAVVAAGAEKRALRQGEGIFINSGVLHAAWAADGLPCRVHSLVFHPRLVGGGLDSVFWQSYTEPLTRNAALQSVCLDASAPWRREGAQAVERAWQSCALERRGYEFEVRDTLSRLIFLLCENCPAVQAEPSEKALRDGERIKTMLQYIQEHFDGELCLRSVAQSASVSESECLRRFRCAIGLSPMQYVLQYRIQKAAGLLSSTTFSVAEVGARCGFLETSYFIKAFRMQKGCTPGGYRRRD